MPLSLRYYQKQGRNIKYVNFWELCKNIIKLVVEGLLCEFDLSHVELPNARNWIIFVNNCRCFSLSFWEDYIHQIL